MSTQQHYDVGPTEAPPANEVLMNGSGLGIDYLLTNDTEQRARMLANRGALEYEEWEELTDTVVESRRQSLGLVGQLQGAGLATDADVAELVTKWQTVDNISEEAEVSVEYGHRSDEEGQSFGLDGAPLPLFQKYWRIDRRFLEHSRRGPGGPIDTRMAAQVTRAVDNTIEDAFLNGWNRPVDGYQMHGFLNHPDTNSVTGSSWHDDTNDAENVRSDLLDSIEALENDEYDEGGYHLGISRSEGQRLRRLLADFGSGNPGNTNMLQRIQEEFSDEIADVFVTKNIPDGEAVLYQPTQDVVQMGMAEDIQPVEWESPDGSTVHIKVIGAMNLQLTSTADGQMGVVHLTGLNA